MCNKPCIYRNTGDSCSCENNDWEEDENAQSQEEDDTDVKIGTSKPDDLDT